MPATPAPVTLPVALAHGPAEVEYFVSGTGPGLVLVHGTFADALGNWQPLIDAVADRYTVVAVNLVGSGGSTGPETVSADDLAGLVAAAAEHAGLDTYHLVGHSLGAVTAAALAARHPRRVRSLALHAPWARTDARGRYQFALWERLLREDPARLGELLQLTAFRPEATAGADNEDVAASVQGLAGMVSVRHVPQLRADRDADLRDRLPHVTAPTLVLVSGRDQIVPPADQRAVAAAIPGAALEEFDAGHALPFEDGDGFVKAVTAFLDAH
ncbi:alpha/beta fold hydrolase [Yinghuangia seranimata]|uniref:alpha/beta fold hydrolase n=1 Tax=Yinghuangia seranimata TaxID=408067 RepID=UPI00248B7FF0|nr:alpha/beta fold hydrolase [Yinghuangia seranimata]MDI2129552.1 alpha/beta fold hydrolase [Yinghuangia seranimata]